MEPHARLRQTNRGKKKAKILAEEDVFRIVRIRERLVDGTEVIVLAGHDFRVLASQFRSLVRKQGKTHGVE